MRIAAAAVIQFHLKIPFLAVIVRMAGWLAAIWREKKVFEF